METILINTDDAAILMCITKQRVWAMTRSGLFPRGVIVRLGSRQIRFSKNLLLEWVEAGGSPIPLHLSGMNDLGSERWQSEIANGEVKEDE